MSSSSAARHAHLPASAGETEPLFSADDEDIGSGTSDRRAAAALEAEDGQANGASEVAAHYPPPKYLKSTFTSREHEFDASDDFIDPALQTDPNDVPVLTGLLESARSRGSIDSPRRTSDSSLHGHLSVEDAALERGLVVGLGQGGGMLASVS